MTSDGPRNAGRLPPGDRQVLFERLVEAADNGVRSDVAVSGWLHEARSRTHERFAAGEVLIDGRPVSKSRRLRAGEHLTVAAPPAGPAQPSAPPQPVPIRWSDEHLAVVAKPAGLAVHTGAGVRDGTLVDALRAMGVPLADTGDPDRPGIIHRLDRGTSGLLIVAKTERARAGLTSLLKRHEVRRTYSAIVDGVPDSPQATIEAPIARSASHRTRFAVDPAGRPARSHYDVIEAFGRAALLDVRLETGRTHQVRVHLSAIGHPVTGDLAYGASPALRDALGLTRPALHARRIAFKHPVTGIAVDVTEPLPPDFEEALRRLGAGV